MRGPLRPPFPHPPPLWSSMRARFPPFPPSPLRHSWVQTSLKNPSSQRCSGRAHGCLRLTPQSKETGQVTLQRLSKPASRRLCLQSASTTPCRQRIVRTRQMSSSGRRLSEPPSTTLALSSHPRPPPPLNPIRWPVVCNNRHFEPSPPSQCMAHHLRRFQSPLALYYFAGPHTLLSRQLFSWVSLRGVGFVYHSLA